MLDGSYAQLAAARGCVPSCAAGIATGRCFWCTGHCCTTAAAPGWVGGWVGLQQHELCCFYITFHGMPQPNVP